jgi:hypothetical protein
MCLCLEYLSSLAVPAKPLYGRLLIADGHGGDGYCRLLKYFSCTGSSLWSSGGVVVRSTLVVAEFRPFPFPFALSGGYYSEPLQNTLF